MHAARRAGVAVSFARKVARAKAARAAPRVPGIYHQLVLHDDHCKAPLFPCTCKPDTTYVPMRSVADFERVAKLTQDWRADVRRRLD